VSRRAIGAAAIVALVLSIVGTTRAQSVEALPAPPQATTATDSALESRTAAVASTLRCPVCQGESIQESPAQLAQDMKAIVRDQLRAGKTPDEIRAYFVSRYGEWILLEPAMRGLNVLLYVFPVALVIGGLALVVVLVRRWSKAEATTQ
jgi:cytochrome c-type biogenesis protein CcmH